MKAVLKGKFIALSDHIKKTEKEHIGDFTARLKALEKKKQTLLRGVEEWK